MLLSVSMEYRVSLLSGRWGDKGGGGVIEREVGMLEGEVGVVEGRRGDRGGGGVVEGEAGVVEGR